MTSELDCQISRQLRVGGFGNVVCANQPRPAQRTDGGNDQDATRPTLDHLSCNHLNDCMVREEVVFDDLAELIIANLRNRAEVRIAGRIADQNVDGAMSRASFVDEFLELPLDGDVDRHSNRPANAALLNGLRYL